MAEVSLSAKLSYHNVLVTSESKLVYLLAEAKPGAEVGYAPASLNLAVVIDKSGSMYAAEKLEYVKESVQYVIDQLRPNDICSIIAFADKARVVIPAGQIVDKIQAKRMIRSIDSVDVGSGTEMLKGIDSAIGEVRRYLVRDKVNHVVLLTDGLTQKENQCKDRCGKESESGISFSTIGVGDDFNEKLLIDIANSGGGKSYYIDDPHDIPDIFAQELKGVQSVMVQNAQLQVRLSKDIEVRRAFKVKPLINDLGTLPFTDRTSGIKLGDLQKDELQSVLLELVLPSRQSGSYRLCQLKLFYDIPAQGVSAKSIDQDIAITYTTDSALASVVDPEVMNVVDLVSVFKQQTRALELAQAGDKAKATQLLKAAATTLLERGQTELANQAMAEAGRIESGAGVSSSGTKKLEYGTRKLTQMLDQFPPET